MKDVRTGQRQAKNSPVPLQIDAKTSMQWTEVQHCLAEFLQVVALLAGAGAGVYVRPEDKLNDFY